MIVGPSIVARGFVLLVLPGSGGGYRTTFFLPLAILGFGMAVSVAPLTTTVMNAVDARHTGIALFCSAEMIKPRPACSPISEAQTSRTD